MSATGSTFLEDPSSSALLAIARANVAGFDDILDALGEGPKTVDELLVMLRATLGVTSGDEVARYSWSPSQS